MTNKEGPTILYISSQLVTETPLVGLPSFRHQSSFSRKLFALPSSSLSFSRPWRCQKLNYSRAGRRRRRGPPRVLCSRMGAHCLTNTLTHPSADLFSKRTFTVSSPCPTNPSKGVENDPALEAKFGSSEQQRIQESGGSGERQCETALSSLIPRKSISMRSSLTCCCVDHSSLQPRKLEQCRTVLSSVMLGPKRTSILQGRRSTFPRVCVRLGCVFPAKTGSPSLLLPIHGQSRTRSQGSTVCATSRAG